MTGINAFLLCQPRLPSQQQHRVVKQTDHNSDQTEDPDVDVDTKKYSLAVELDILGPIPIRC